MLLAGVFATAGFAKLADREGSRRAVAEFGVPRRLAWLLGSLLPLVELAAAGLLVPAGSARFGALLAAALLLAFSAAIAVNLRQGRAPECRCFGQVHSAPVTWRAVARNLALAGLAAAITLNAGTALDRTEALGASLAIVLAALLLVARGAKRAEDVPLDFSEGLPVGADAPAFELRSREGDTVTLAALLARGKPVVLLFTDGHCGPCVSLRPEIAQWQRSLSKQLTIAVLERGGREASEGEDEYGRSLVLFQQDEEVAQAYLAEGTPVAVQVGADGKIASGVAPGSVAIRRLVGAEEVEPEPRHEPGLPRRAFLLRVAGAVAAITPLLSLPSRAFAATRPPKRCSSTGFLFRFFPHDCGGEDCTNVLEDSENCMLCGKVCPQGSVCAGGKCVRGDKPGCNCLPARNDEPGVKGLSRRRVCCEGAKECITLAANESHCGGCGKRCTGKKPECCSGICRDVSANPAHCGNCNTPCPPDKPLCVAGECRASCPPGLRPCPPKRPGLAQERGTCGQQSSERCCGGRLYSKEQYPVEEYTCCDGTLKPKNGNKSCGPKCHVCDPILRPVCCGGTCANLDQNIPPGNCGTCGNKCKPGEFCRFGACAPQG